MLTRCYYYKYSDLEESYKPFSKLSFETTILENILDLTEVEKANLMLPANLVSSVVNDLLSLVMGKYHEHAIIKIEVPFCIVVAPSNEDKLNHLIDWAYKFIALLNDTYEYYGTLLANYTAAKSDLMADIKATSKNKVKFNDTPQNPNTLDVYEGDDYITHFTKTEGETSSPLMSKIMRLKEIQDHYKSVLSDWVKEFERIFYQEEC